MNNNLIVITGQTATGKTALALKHAREQNGELVNADSRQVYRGLDIITGKDLDELKASGVPYHLFDLVDPKDRFSSHEYAVAAAPVVEGIWRRGRTPVIVGGSYLYIKHLLYGFDIAVEPNHQLRMELEGKGVAELQQLLAPRPATINDSDWNNPRRLIRRIEVARSEQDPKQPKKPWIPAFAGMTMTIVGLKHANRDSLERAIADRVSKRLGQGAVAEVEHLVKQGYTSKDPGLETIGYTQIIAFLNGEITREDAIKEWTRREIQYAKRQFTFMKKDSKIVWGHSPY